EARGAPAESELDAVAFVETLKHLADFGTEDLLERHGTGYNDLDRAPALDQAAGHFHADEARANDNRSSGAGGSFDERVRIRMATQQKDVFEIRSRNGDFARHSTRRYEQSV